MKFDQNIVQSVVERLKNGDIVIVPTDTVYGIIADSTNKKAVELIYKIKKRLMEKQLIHLVSDMKMAKSIAIIPENIEQILESEWQTGKRPLTAVLKAKGLGGTIAIRKPQSDFLIKIISILDSPIVAPSANISNEPPGTTYEQVLKNFENSVHTIIDGGILNNVPSKIVDFSEFPFRILRD